MTSNIQFGKYPDGLVPVIVQNSATGMVLMLGYMNRDALDQTLETGFVTFYSRTRGRLWTKGETSGNYLRLEKMRVDCDGDAVLIQAVPSGPTCHTGTTSCFGTAESAPRSGIIYELESIICERRADFNKDSYISALFGKGINRIAQKVGEEAVELVIEAKDDNINSFKSEAADLVFHLLLLLHARDVEWDEILEILVERRR